ncbi:hypothetical protein diail_10415 [Diaporthe ilicicola]|nr:hypothetical protein diail_10415 [Diaporthe ilicicola]
MFLQCDVRRQFLASVMTPAAEPSSVLALVCKEPRADVVHLEKAKDPVRSSTLWVLLTSDGQRYCQIASRAGRSSWCHVPGILLSTKKDDWLAIGVHPAHNATVDNRSDETLMWHDDADLAEVGSSLGT